MNYLKAIFTVSLVCLIIKQTNAQTIIKPAYKQTEIIRVENIKTSADIYSLSADQKTVILEYVDGQARPIQTVVQKGSPTGKDIVQPIAYDQYGFEQFKYLPYVSGTVDGSYQTNVLASQASFYANGPSDKVVDDSKPYARIQYEDSPLKRILKAGSVGEGYQPDQHYKSAFYRANTTADEVRVWKLDGSSSSVYPAGELSVTVNMNESGNKTCYFKNRAGEMVLQRVQADETINGVTEAFFDTYYVFNAVGKIRYMIPPKAVSQMKNSNNWLLSSALAEELVYSYVYDPLGRLTEKKIPGSASIYIIYDSLDRPLLVQDGNLRSQNQWRYIKYDIQQRAVSEGIYTDASHTNLASMQAYVNTIDFSAAYYEERRSGTSYGYSNQQFPTTGTDALLYYYYDNYDLNNDGARDYSYQAQSLPGEGFPSYLVRGSLTAVRKKVIGSNTWLISMNFFDKRGNVIQVLGNNQLNSSVSDSRTQVYDFSGKVLLVKVVKNSSSAATTVRSIFSYDGGGRLKTVDDSYNGAAAIRIASYEYNELGQVADKKLHSVNGGSSYLQSVDFRYTIRGALASINNSTLTADERNDDTDDVFGMEMLYEQADGLIGNRSYYDGMLSAVKWKSKEPQGSTPKERSYRFEYDKLLRLKNAFYQDRSSGSGWENIGAFDEKNLRYDQNGNILALQRNAYIGSTITMMDDLEYSYSGNRLDNLNDLASPALGYKNLTGSASGYTYETSGSLSIDPRKGLIHTYNVLGKVERISISTASGRYLNYTYDGSGALLQKQQYDNQVLQKTTDYIDGFVYENGELSYFGMSEGRVRNTGTGLKAEYMMRDYQGNVRVSFEEQNGQAVVRQENSYYPYGLVMPGGTLPGQANKQLYNGGSEWQNDYGDLPDYYQTYYRNYDAATGRFMGLDPLSERYAYQSPYQYSGNNPVMFNDPLGANQVPLSEAIAEMTGGAYGGTWNATGDGSGELTIFENQADAWKAGTGLLDAMQAWGKYGFADNEYRAAREFVSRSNEVKGGSYQFSEKGGMYFVYGNNAEADRNNTDLFRGGVTLFSYGVIPQEPDANQGGLVDMSARFDKQLQQTESFFSTRSSELESMHVFPGTKSITRLLYFTKMVKTNAPYDLKSHGYTAKQIGFNSLYLGQVFRFDDFGNYNYGVAARAYGLSLEMALIGAGLNQIWNGRGDSSNWSFYGDDPRDTRMIIEGYFRKDNK